MSKLHSISFVTYKMPGMPFSLHYHTPLTLLIHMGEYGTSRRLQVLSKHYTTKILNTYKITNTRHGKYTLRTRHWCCIRLQVHVTSGQIRSLGSGEVCTRHNQWYLAHSILPHTLVYQLRHPVNGWAHKATYIETVIFVAGYCTPRSTMNTKTTIS